MSYYFLLVTGAQLYASVIDVVDDFTFTFSASSSFFLHFYSAFFPKTPCVQIGVQQTYTFP